MKSIFNKKFNHDSIADKYDEDVKNEKNPIRTGYDSMLSWVNDKTSSSKIILDLGSGTGNTIEKLSGDFDKIVCVDISEKMLKIAKEKLKNRKNISFVKSDLLKFVDNKNESFDTVISTYAIHHLTQKEKHYLFEKINNILSEKGKIVFGDLMFENREYEKKMRLKYPELVEDFNDELYWYVDEETKKIQDIGFNVEVKKFSDLSWGIYGIRK